MYSLPNELWEDEVMEGIGNMLGNFVKTFEITKKGHYTSYTRICVYINVSKLLPEAICIRYQDT